MSLIQQIKRAAKDHNLYDDEIDDNWGPKENIMYSRLCDKFGGNFASHPTRSHQSSCFLEWIDRYLDSDYTEEDKADFSVVNPGGADFKQLVPERQPVNTEGASKQDIKERDNMVNRNVIQPPKEPKKIVEDENDRSNVERTNEGTGSLRNEETEDGKISEGTDTTAQSDGGKQDSEETKNSGEEAKLVENTESTRQDHSTSSLDSIKTR